MLLLCGIFLQSCTEEMPILTSANTTITGSYIKLNIDNKAYTIVNKLPGYVYFSNITVGVGTNLVAQLTVAGNNGNQNNLLDYALNFSEDTSKAGSYDFASSKLSLNGKSYITTNPYGKAKLNINQLDDTAKTANGSFAYYVYNSASNPTDSVYVTGTFNVVKQ